MRLMRSVWLSATVAVMGCAAIHRERAPEMMFNTTTPVGFESVVRYANGYAN
jgi:hypothetical protein